MDLETCLSQNRETIIQEWARRLHVEGSSDYRSRPRDELARTTSLATDGYFDALIHKNFLKIESFIEKITRMRLKEFALPSVQAAFELYRSITAPILLEALDGACLLDAVQRLNSCLSFTIQKFSDYFKTLHEQQLKNYAIKLEIAVRDRTRELAESEEKYRVLVEEIRDGYFVNQEGKIVFANRTYCEMHGYTREETIGRSYKDFVSPSSLPEVEHIYETRISENRSVDRYVYYRRHKDGSRFPSENKVTIMNYGGKSAAVGICRDITERMEMEQKIRDSERLAHIGKITAELGHEIRNPLSSIKVNLDAFLNKLDLEGYDKRRMEIMSHEISRLEKILSEMLDFSRPVKLDLKPVAINDLLVSSLEVLEAKISEKSLFVLNNLSPQVSKIMVDPEKMEQAFINILLNSIEMLPEYGEIEIITSREFTGEDHVRITFSDNGPGASEEDLAFLFDPFFSSRRKGTGLGLTNVKKVVEAHGGGLKVFARRPEGLCIEMLVPARS